MLHISVYIYIYIERERYTYHASKPIHLRTRVRDASSPESQSTPSLHSLSLYIYIYIYTYMIMISLCASYHHHVKMHYNMTWTSQGKTAFKHAESERSEFRCQKSSSGKAPDRATGRPAREAQPTVQGARHFIKIARCGSQSAADDTTSVPVGSGSKCSS